MRNNRLFVVIICLLLVVAALPFASACGPGVPTLRVGMMTPTTGGAA